MSTSPQSDTRFAWPAEPGREWEGLLEGQPWGAIAVDEQLTVLFATPGAGRLLHREVRAGITLSELLPEWSQSDALLAEDRRTGADLRRELQHGLELAVLHRWLWIRLDPVKTPQGKASAALWLFDMTDMRRTLDNRAESLRFLSHDLRSPQNSIVAMTQLHEHDPAAFEACGGMQRIAELARYALSLGDQFIFTSVAGALRHRDFARFDLHAAVRSVIPKLEVAAVHRNVALQLWLADGPAVWVSGVQMFVMRALQNLIDNAIQASRTGQRVTVSLKIVDEHAVIFVCDEVGGLPGLSPERPMTDFDALSLKSAGGYGIGLKLAARIVALHAGTPHAQVNHESGTDFVMRLPRLVLQASAHALPDDRRTGFAAARSS